MINKLINTGYGGAVGGNSDNGTNAGAFYFNLSNAFTNANWNIAASLAYTYYLNALPYPCLLAKFTPARKRLSVGFSESGRGYKRMEMIFIKSYKNLWNKIISDENIRLAIYNASHGNMKRKVLENMKCNPDKYIEAVRRWIENFEPAEHTPNGRCLHISAGLNAQILICGSKGIFSQE